jgi:hypothetical protein
MVPYVVRLLSKCAAGPNGPGSNWTTEEDRLELPGVPNPPLTNGPTPCFRTPCRIASERCLGHLRNPEGPIREAASQSSALWQDTPGPIGDPFANPYLVPARQSDPHPGAYRGPGACLRFLWGAGTHGRKSKNNNNRGFNVFREVAQIDPGPPRVAGWTLFVAARRSRERRSGAMQRTAWRTHTA